MTKGWSLILSLVNHMNGVPLGNNLIGQKVREIE